MEELLPRNEETQNKTMGKLTADMKTFGINNLTFIKKGFEHALAETFKWELENSTMGWFSLKPFGRHAFPSKKQKQKLLLNSDVVRFVFFSFFVSFFLKSLNESSKVQINYVCTTFNAEIQKQTFTKANAT